jgi:ubiquinone biosynthesis protein UbiJ
MEIGRSISTSLPRTTHMRRRLGAPPGSARTMEARLVKAESELGVQFTRIAQLQAEVDRLAAALRKLSESTGIRIPGGQPTHA